MCLRRFGSVALKWGYWKLGSLLESFPNGPELSATRQLEQAIVGQRARAQVNLGGAIADSGQIVGDSSITGPRWFALSLGCRFDNRRRCESAACSQDIARLFVALKCASQYSVHPNGTRLQISGCAKVNLALTLRVKLLKSKGG
jgi:hypothetical protein